MSPEDRIVNLLSHWLAKHVDDDELRRELAEVDLSTLGPEGREAVGELRVELARRNRGGELERSVRETLETLALGH
jgi:hypothetical protein